MSHFLRTPAGLLLVLVFAFLGPGSLAEEPSAGAVGEVITTKSGLQYVDLVIGEGPEVRRGDTVRVHYIGRLDDGTVFDSSRPRGQPFAFPVGRGKVIRGWDEGVVGMQIGGKRKLVIPSKLAYGKSGFGNVIPPNSTLTFEIELLGLS